MYKISSIKKGYTGGYGKIYSNICSCPYKIGSDWKLVYYNAESLKYSSLIYQSRKNPNVGIKIFNRDEIVVDGGRDRVAELVSNLQGVQKNVKYTDFPLGVVYKGGIIVGQIIPYYQDYESLSTVLSQNKTDSLKVYKNLLKVLQELYDNGIIYIDIHAMNILWHDNESMPKLVDFDDKFVKFDTTSNYYIGSMFNNFAGSVNAANIKTDVYDIVGEFKTVSSFDDAKMQIEEMENTLIRKRTK